MGEAQAFRVDLRGVVDLLSRHLYSSPRVFMRELLQNGVDAITARRDWAAEHGATVDPAWSITVSALPDDGRDDAGDAAVFAFHDDGIGLTADEVAAFLTVVGSSSKRDMFDLRRGGYLGQFGIGLLSCFMVSDSIRVLSRSATGAPAVEWVGQADGMYTVGEADDQTVPVGTTVYLAPRFDTGEFLRYSSVCAMARDYGEFLPLSITVTQQGSPGVSSRIDRHPVFLDGLKADRGLLDEYAREAFGFAPFDVIDLTAPGTDVAGKAFVLPFAPAPNAHQANRVYLGRMLLSERADGLLPDWAFFVRVVLNTTDLNPTASREDLVDDYLLEHVREKLGEGLRRWLLELATREPYRLARFLAIHELAIKRLVVHDDELAAFISGWLTLETTKGRLRISELVSEHPRVRYAETVDEFRQLAPVVGPDDLLVCGGYSGDLDLIQVLPQVYPAVVVERVDVVNELDRLDPPPLADRPLTAAMEDRASDVLRPRGCRAVVRLIAHADLPALYVADPEVFRHLDRGRVRRTAGPGLWGGILGRMEEFSAEIAGDSDDPLAQRLCLNWANPLVRQLASLDDQVVFSRCLDLLYVQAQLASHRPLGVDDRRLMTTALSDLIALSVGLGTDPGDSQAQPDTKE